MFEQYAASLEINLAFQDFEKELQLIAVQYNKPKGALILAYEGDKAVACTGVRKLDNDTAELKRMFVQPKYRGHKIAQQMLTIALDMAKHLGYKTIRLDTIPSMKQAQSLYHAQGFYQIPPYRFNPVEGTIFMEKILGR